MNEYMIGLLLIAGPLAVCGRGAIARCAAIIILNWVAGYEFNELFGTFTPWVWTTMIDTIAAAVILWHPAGRWQAVIGATYVLQIACHSAFAAWSWGAHSYWLTLTAIAWVQLMILGTWGCERVLNHLVIRHHNSKIDAANIKGVEL
jgi:hypothetical protein